MVDGLLKDQIRGDPDIAGMLTTYKGKPAFFYQKSPPDTDRNWEKPCYPRVDYNIDMRYDPERKTSGAMAINVWCTSESEAMPEDIEKRLVELISEAFYTNSDGATVCAVWKRSDAFAFEAPASAGSNTAPEVLGVTLLFDLLEFPEQITTSPDPIQGLNVWSKALFPNATIIGPDRMPAIWRPSGVHPAIYWRFEGANASDRQGYAVNWYTGTFAAHIIAESVVERNRWIKAMVEVIQLEGEIILSDRSPLFVNRIAIRHGSDPLREGQLLLTGQYGVLAQHRRERVENLLTGPFGTFGSITSSNDNGNGMPDNTSDNSLNDYSGNPLNRAIFPTLDNMEVSTNGKNE